jgi:hypothetical protein
MRDIFGLLSKPLQDMSKPIQFYIDTSPFYRYNFLLILPFGNISIVIVVDAAKGVYEII